MHLARKVAALLALASLTAACGARLSDAEMAAVGRSGAGAASAGVAGSDAALGGTDAGGAAVDGTAIGAGGTTDGGSAAGDPAAGGGDPGTAGPDAGGAPGDGGPGAPLPPGGNGGATDVGVTATEIALGNVATLTGPVPGLFRGALVGAQAWAAYQNSIGGIHGRKVRIVAADDRLDANANRTGHANLADKVFAFVGSFSVTEESGAAVLKEKNIPDVGYALSVGRRTLPNNFSPQPAREGWALGPLQWFKTKFGPDVITKMAGFYGDVDASEKNYRNQKRAAESIGFRYLFDQPLQPTESNYTPYVLRMRQQGARGLVMTFDATGMARMAKAMQQQNYKVDAPLYGGNVYDHKFLQLAGSAAEGAIWSQAYAMFLGEDTIPEVKLFNTWMKKVAPDFGPDLFAVFAWSSGRLFAQAALAGPPQMTRAALLEQLRKIDKFDANGLLAEGGPASKRPPTCYLIAHVKGGKFARVDPPSGYKCDAGYFE